MSSGPTIDPTGVFVTEEERLEVRALFVLKAPGSTIAERILELGKAHGLEERSGGYGLNLESGELLK